MKRIRSLLTNLKSLQSLIFRVRSTNILSIFNSTFTSLSLFCSPILQRPSSAPSSITSTFRSQLLLQNVDLQVVSLSFFRHHQVFVTSNIFVFDTPYHPYISFSDTMTFACFKRSVANLLVYFMLFRFRNPSNSEPSSLLFHVLTDG